MGALCSVSSGSVWNICSMDGVKTSFRRLSDMAGSAVGVKPKPKTWQEEVGEQLDDMGPSLSFQERLIGFACCCGFGVLISLGSFFRFSRLLAGHPTAFALCFSL